MTFFTFCANLGHPCSQDREAPLVDRQTGLAALAALRELLSFCPPEALDWNSIALHEAMVERDDLVYCPAVYCYATYAEADIRKPLRFSDLPGLRGPRLCWFDHWRNRDRAFDFLRGAGGGARLYPLSRQPGDPESLCPASRPAGPSSMPGKTRRSTRGSADVSPRRGRQWRRPGSARAMPAI